MTFITYDEDNYILQKYYSENTNIDIRYNDSNNNLCYIYFSSNALYRANDQISFNRIIANNRFEWKNLSADILPKKEIFLRDIWLSWYVKGVNSQLNSIDAIIDWLKKETSGYEVVTVGNSSGGYIATIVAIKLKAKLCYNISGQFSLENHNNHVQENPILCKYASTDRAKYYESYKMLEKSDISVVYCYPVKVDHDVVQSKFVKYLNNVYDFSFDSDRHGVTVSPYSLPAFISCDLNQIKKIYSAFKNRIINSKEFSFALCGKKGTLQNMANYKKRKIVNRLKKVIGYFLNYNGIK